jgi:hypothetical protein
MRRYAKYIPGFFVGAAFVFLICWTLGWLPPSHVHYCHGYEANNKECPTYHITLVALWQLGIFLNYISAAIAALATVAIAYFTLILKRSTDKLWDAGERQLDLGARTAERELRAYITGPNRVDFRNFQTPRPICILQFTNMGQTPAHDVGYWIKMFVGPYPLEERPGRESADEGFVGVVSPRGQITTESTADTDILTQEARQTAINGTSAFYLYGELSYVDAFNQKRGATFCHFLRGELARNRVNGGLPSYDKWNTAT